jgi:hypothetical protein
MGDYFETGTSISKSKNFLEQLFFKLYDRKLKFTNDVFLGLNLQWPSFNLPDSYSKYIISFHTEYIHLEWIISQAKKIYPKTVTLITDYNISFSDIWPDNVQFVPWITMHKQIKILQQQLGVNNNIQNPTYKISSLSFRISQYKNFVTAYLLKNFPHNDMILTYHGFLAKSEDLHGHPPGYPELDQLDFSLLKKTTLNFNDNFSGNTAVANGNWQNECYTDALINLTNESFHYSNTVINDQNYCWPGPYLTEKTFKPLLAGRPFLVAGQYQTYKFLELVGFRTDFGLDTCYDNDSGDLTRICKLFRTLDYINDTPKNQLFDHSIDAVRHNVKWIQSNNFYDQCQEINQKTDCLIC